MYFLGKKYDKKSDVDQIKRDVQEIENNLEALGSTVRPYFCANTRQFYFLVQTQAVPNRF
jgi:hypothetical protein